MLGKKRTIVGLNFIQKYNILKLNVQYYGHLGGLGGKAFNF